MENSQIPSENGGACLSHPHTSSLIESTPYFVDVPYPAYAKLQKKSERSRRRCEG